MIAGVELGDPTYRIIRDMLWLTVVAYFARFNPGL